MLRITLTIDTKLNLILMVNQQNDYKSRTQQIQMELACIGKHATNSNNYDFPT